MAAKLSAVLGETIARIAEIETWETEAILAELGRLIPEYTIETVVVHDARPSEAGPGDDRVAYGISFQVARPGYMFHATANPSSWTIRDAAVRAIQGAIAILGPEVQP